MKHSLWDSQQKKLIFSEKRAKIAKSAPPFLGGGQSIFSKLQFLSKMTIPKHCWHEISILCWFTQKIVNYWVKNGQNWPFWGKCPKCPFPPPGSPPRSPQRVNCSEMTLLHQYSHHISILFWFTWKIVNYWVKNGQNWLFWGKWPLYANIRQYKPLRWKIGLGPVYKGHLD